MSKVVSAVLRRDNEEERDSAAVSERAGWLHNGSGGTGVGGGNQEKLIREHEEVQ